MLLAWLVGRSELGRIGDGVFTGQKGGPVRRGKVELTNTT